ncbi:uncharacterized protein LOC117263099 [Epinephelus lanceolatus]
MLDPDAFVDAPEGDLYLDKITERDSGTYRCTVQNLVGMEDCELILKITSPSTVTDGHGPIAGTTAEITAGVGMEDCEPVLNITFSSTVIDGRGPNTGTTAEITAGVGMEDFEPVLNITSPSTVIDGRGPTAGTTAEITAGVGMEDCEPILNITSPSTVIDGRGPTAGTTAEITAGVGMEDCEPVLNITSPSTVIDGRGPTAGTTAGAIVAVIVVITVTLTPVIYYRLRKRREMLRRNAYIWAQRNSCICRPIRIEQLRCEEEDNLYERTETTNPVLSSFAEDNEKNASTEEGLTACVEAKEPCSLHTENGKNASHEEIMTAL